MDENQDQRFPWSILLLVTGICLMAFSYLMAFLDGGHITIFLKLGPLLIGLSVVAFLNSWLSKKFLSKTKSSGERSPKSEDYLRIQ